LAKKSLIAKAQREPKFKVRNYNQMSIMWTSKRFSKEVWYLQNLFPQLSISW